MQTPRRKKSIWGRSTWIVLKNYSLISQVIGQKPVSLHQKHTQESTSFEKNLMSSKKLACSVLVGRHLANQRCLQGHGSHELAARPRTMEGTLAFLAKWRLGQDQSQLKPMVWYSTCPSRYSILVGSFSIVLYAIGNLQLKLLHIKTYNH